MQHYKPRKISLIVKADKFIAVVGRIASVADGSVVLDDGTGRLEIASEHALRQDAMVRVFCSFDNGWRADIVQDMAGTDLNIYKKVDELYNRAGL